MRTGLLAALAMSATLPVQAAMLSTPLDYAVDGVAMQSRLVYDDAVKTPRPGLVMVPDWFGITPANLALAKEIAGRDYVILVADLYGAKTRPRSAEEAGAAVSPLYEDRGVLRARVKAAFGQLRAQVGKAPLDGRHWGGLGFCFGGTAILDLARSGADVAGVVSFHGNLAGDPAHANDVKARVLVLHGADDPYEPPEQIAAFQQEMRAARADWEFISYGGAVHCFAVPSATGDNPGCKYHPTVAKRAYARMRAFFDEAFTSAVP